VKGNVPVAEAIVREAVLPEHVQEGLGADLSIEENVTCSAISSRARGGPARRSSGSCPRSAGSAGARPADGAGVPVPPAARSARPLSGGRFSETRATGLHDLGYAVAWVAWASIVRPSPPSVICTLRGFADSATGMCRVSTPVS
jgi:hypothetical protein